MDKGLRGVGIYPCPGDALQALARSQLEATEGCQRHGQCQLTQGLAGFTQQSQLAPGSQ